MEDIDINISNDSNESKEDSIDSTDSNVNITFETIQRVFGDDSFDLSEIFPNSFTERKLTLLREYADRANIGDKLFLLTNHCPLAFSTLEITGQEVNGEIVRSEDLVGHTESHLLPVPRSYIRLLKIGYRWYEVNGEKEPSQAVNPNPFFNRKKWKKRFEIMVDLVNQNIRESHGIKCYLNGNIQDEGTNNIIYLHFCDIISVLLHRRNLNMEAEVRLASDRLHMIQTTLKDNLSARVFNEKGINFLLDNADIFYMIYGYWHNFSKLSLRLWLSSELKTVQISRHLIKDGLFQYVQEGKIQELSREIYNEEEKELLCLR